MFLGSRILPLVGIILRMIRIRPHVTVLSNLRPQQKGALPPLMLLVLQLRRIVNLNGPVYFVILYKPVHWVRGPRVHSGGAAMQ